MLTRRRAKKDEKGPEYWLTQNKDPPGTTVREASREIGLGVFTTRFFSKGEFILEYAGELKYATQTLDSEQTYIYYFQNNGKSLCIDATWNIDRRGRYVNDEWKKPNAIVKKILLGKTKTPKLAIFALKNIEEGLEVRFDYGDQEAPWRQKEVVKEGPNDSGKGGGCDLKEVSSEGPSDYKTGDGCDLQEVSNEGPSDYKRGDGCDLKKNEVVGPSDSGEGDSSDSDEVSEEGPDDHKRGDGYNFKEVSNEGPSDYKRGDGCDLKKNEVVGPSDSGEGDSSDSDKTEVVGPSDSGEGDSSDLDEISNEGPDVYKRGDGYDLQKTEVVGPHGSGKGDSSDSDEVSEESLDDYENGDGCNFEKTEVVGPHGSGKGDSSDSDEVSEESLDDYENGDGCNFEKTEVVGPHGSGKGDRSDSDEISNEGPDVYKRGDGYDLQKTEVVGPHGSGKGDSSDSDELTGASTNGGGFLPALVPYSSSSESDESYVIPIKKSRRVNQILCSGSGSDYDEEGVQNLPKCQVNLRVHKEVDNIPSFSSGSDTEGTLGKEQPVLDVSVPSSSGVKACRTSSLDNMVRDKKLHKKGRKIDQTLYEEGIQHLPPCKASARMCEEINEVPSFSSGSDTEDNVEEEEPVLDESVPSSDGVKVCRTNNQGRRVWDKKHYCVYCMKAFPKLPRHLEQVHASERDVAEALSFSKHSRSRKMMFDLLRNKGNHAHNIEVLKTQRGYIIPAKRPTCDVPASDYLPCSQCYGYYIGSDMWKHLKFCTAKELHAEMKKGERHQARCALLLPVSGVASSAFQKNVLGAMIRDDISLVARQDDMINKFGERMYSRLGHEKHQYNYISQKMRELARLLLAIRGTHPKYAQVSLTDVIRPQHFDTVMECVHTCSGFNGNSCTYKIPSLALKLGHSLKKCASILKADAIRAEDSQLKTAAENFVELCDIEWSHKVSSSALATLEERKWNKPDMLPLSEDIIKLHKYLGDVTAEAKGQLPLKSAWITLAEATLTKIILFNRRRSGEAQRIKVNEFAGRHTGSMNKDVLQSLTTWEQALCKKLDRIEIKGKRGRKVPVLLTEEMTESLELLVKHRTSIGISSENVFIFARANGNSQMCIRGSDCLRKFAIKSSAKSPSYLTSTKLRKQIATVSQIFCLRDNELDILAGFMGHDIRVHRDYYRLPEDALQTAKVARLLMLMEKGLVADFKDKTLSEIEVTLDDPSYNDSDEADAEEELEGEEEEVDADGEEEEEDLEGKEQEDKEGEEDREKQKVPGARKVIWTPAETKAIEKHFAKHIRLLKVPRKHECDECIRENPLLSQHPWKRIKFKVYSMIQKRKK